MIICKGKTKLGKSCKLKVKGENTYCTRHQRKKIKKYTGGVKTNIKDLEQHISKFLDLETLETMGEISKQHNLDTKNLLGKRQFKDWQLLKKFNRIILTPKNIQKIIDSIDILIYNKEFLNMINQRPITTISLKNLMKIIHKINKSYKSILVIILFETVYLYITKEPSSSKKLIKLFIEKGFELLKDDNYTIKFKNEIREIMKKMIDFY